MKDVEFPVKEEEEKKKKTPVHLIKHTVHVRLNGAITHTLDIPGCLFSGNSWILYIPRLLLVKFSFFRDVPSLGPVTESTPGKNEGH